MWYAGDTHKLIADWTSEDALGITGITTQVFYHDGTNYQYLQADLVTFSTSPHNFTMTANGSVWEYSLKIPEAARGNILTWQATADVTDLIKLGNQHFIAFELPFDHEKFAFVGIL